MWEKKKFKHQNNIINKNIKSKNDAQILNYSNHKKILPKKNSKTLKKSYIPFNEIK